MGGSVSSSYVLGPGEGRVIDLGNFSMTVKASADRSDGAITLLEADEPPHFGPPMHIHHDSAEGFYVLEGEYNIFIEDEVFRCPAGSFVWVPAEVRHGFSVGDVQSRKLNIYLPATMLGYFEELSEAISKGVADPDVLGEIATRNAVEVVGPVPEGYV
jgi:mannose-6-phosphate isomerase-like protein (cupin superfamily)